MVASPAMLDVAGELVTFLAGLLADARRARGTRAGTRALSCGKQALFALVWFRERRDIALVGRGLGISQTTAYRYLDEAIEMLGAQAPICTTRCDTVASRAGRTSCSTARSSTPIASRAPT